MSGVFVVSLFFIIPILIVYFSGEARNAFEFFMHVILYMIFFTIVLIAFSLIEDIFFESGLVATEEREMRIEIPRMEETNESYIIYYKGFNERDDKEELIIEELPKSRVKIYMRETNQKNITIDYKILFSKKDKVLEDRGNYAYINIPKGYKPEIAPKIKNLNDITIKRVTLNHCINDFNYSDNEYSFLVLGHNLKEYKFRENEKVKLEFKEDPEIKEGACLNLDYYETLNGDVVENFDHNAIYEMRTSKGFDIFKMKKKAEVKRKGIYK